MKPHQKQRLISRPEFVERLLEREREVFWRQTGWAKEVDVETEAEWADRICKGLEIDSKLLVPLAPGRK